MPKSKNKNEALPTSFEDLSDIEFIAYADYLSSPYYKAYLESRKQSNIMGKADPYSTISPAKKRSYVQFGGDGYRRRKGFLALIVIFMIAIIAIAALGYIGTIVPEYVSAFNKVEGEEVVNIGVTDPVLGALTKFASMEIDSYFYTDCLENVEDESNIGLKIACYGMPIVVALSLLFALIILIVALAALCKKGTSKGYVEKKTKFGFLSLLLFLFTLFIAACAIVWNGEGLGEIVGFFTGKATSINAGYGLFGFIGLSLLSLIFNWCSYKKVNK